MTPPKTTKVPVSKGPLSAIDEAVVGAAADLPDGEGLLAFLREVKDKVSVSKVKTIMMKASFLYGKKKVGVDVWSELRLELVKPIIPTDRLPEGERKSAVELKAFLADCNAKNAEWSPSDGEILKFMKATMVFPDTT